MAGSIIALTMVMMIPITYAVINKKGVPPSTKAIVGSTLSAALLFCIVFICIPCTPDGRSGSTNPLILASILTGIFLATLDETALKIAAVVITLATGYALTAWATDLVHGDHYVADKNWANGPEVFMRDQAYFAACDSVLKEIEESYSNTRLPEGWIEDSTFLATGSCWFKKGANDVHLYSVTPSWHSWFTHIYRIKETNGGIWCPGGTAGDCQGNLKMRTKPGNSYGTATLPE
jgi:hypothetical protein